MHVRGVRAHPYRLLDRAQGIGRYHGLVNIPDLFVNLFGQNLTAEDRAGHGPDVELVGVWGRDRAKTTETASELGTRPYPDLDRLIADVDALIRGKRILTHGLLHLRPSRSMSWSPDSGPHVPAE